MHEDLGVIVLDKLPEFDSTMNWAGRRFQKSFEAREGPIGWK